MVQEIVLQIVVFLGQQAALSTRSYGSDQLQKTAANAAAFEPFARHYQAHLVPSLNRLKRHNGAGQDYLTRFEGYSVGA